MRLILSILAAFATEALVIYAFRKQIRRAFRWVNATRKRRMAYWAFPMTLGIYVFIGAAVEHRSLVIPSLECAVFGFAMWVSYYSDEERLPNPITWFRTTGADYMSKHGNLRDNNYADEGARIKALSEAKLEADAVCYAEYVERMRARKGLEP